MRTRLKRLGRAGARRTRSSWTSSRRTTHRAGARTGAREPTWDAPGEQVRRFKKGRERRIRSVWRSAGREGRRRRRLKTRPRQPRTRNHELQSERTPRRRVLGGPTGTTRCTCFSTFAVCCSFGGLIPLLAPHPARLLATQEDRTPALPVRPTTFHVAPPSEREPLLPSRSVACLSLRC